MTDFQTKDSGERREFDTGSRRDVRDGKGRFDLLPPIAIRRIAQLLERGADKYGDRNWELGQPLASYVDSMLRHALQVSEGATDEDHLAAVCFNAMAIMDHEVRIAAGELEAALDDRRKQPVESKPLNGFLRAMDQVVQALADGTGVEWARQAPEAEQETKDVLAKLLGKPKSLALLVEPTTGQPETGRVMGYAVIVEYDEADAIFIGTAPDLQGCVAYGTTLAILESKMREAIVAYLRAFSEPQLESRYCGRWAYHVAHRWVFGHDDTYRCPGRL